MTFHARAHSSFTALMVLAFALAPDAVFAASLGQTIRISFQIIFGLLGLAGLGVLIYGFVVLRGGGDDILEHMRGKKLALIGAAAFLISLIIFLVLAFFGSRSELTAEQGDPTIDITQGGAFGATMGEFSKVKSHYPLRDEKNVPRNSAILMTFTEPIQAESIRDAKGTLKKESVAIQGISFAKDRQQAVDATVTLSADNMIAKITPTNPLGVQNERSFYAVTLTSSIKRANGESLFGATGGYAWKFEVSGIIDNTPPSVENVFPAPNGSKNAGVWRNHLIQITFSEAIDPSVLEGQKIEVVSKDKRIEGQFVIGNNYKTVTFIPTEACGVMNSCNAAMQCLPSESPMAVTLRAARLLVEKQSEMPFRALVPYDGIVDIAGNSLDGGGVNGSGKNGKAEGPESDSYSWNFKTTADINKDPVYIARIKPGRDAFEVGSTVPLEVDFSNIMDATTIDPLTVVLGQNLNYWTQTSFDLPSKKTTVIVSHDPFAKQSLYTPEVRAEVRDITQQCFAPCKGPL